MLTLSASKNIHRDAHKQKTLSYSRGSATTAKSGTSVARCGQGRSTVALGEGGARERGDAGRPWAVATDGWSGGVLTRDGERVGTHKAPAPPPSPLPQM